MLVKNIAIIGGDLRIVYLAKMLAKDGFNLKTYGIEKTEELDNLQNIKKCNSLKEVLEETDIAIGPIPLSSDNIKINTPFSKNIITLEELAINLKNKKFIAGNIKKEFYEYAKDKQIEIIDLLEREELVVLNTIATAEGTIQIAIEETTRTIHGSNVLILGFGRVGKTLANMLKGMGTNIYCQARKNSDFAWIKAYGYKSIKFEEKEKLNNFDIIINTIPTLVIGENELNYINKDCLLIDLASSPGGIDRKIAEKMGIKTVWALALPGKVAPLTSAEFIKDTIYNVIKET